MPKAQVIGRVAVKVLPDTSKFRREAQSELNKIEKTLVAHVDAQINEASLKRSALKAVNDLNKVLRTVDAYKVRFHATFSKTSLRTAVAKASRDMEAIAKTEKVKFNADIAATIAEVEATLERTSLKKVERELKDWINDISPMNVDIAPTMLPGASAYVSARLRYLTRPRSVDISPKINSTAFAAAATAIAALSGGRVVFDALDGIFSRLKRLDKAVPIVGTLAEAIAGLGAYGMTAASNLAALSMSLAQIGPAVLALPGIFGGIAIGVGATIAVLKDFNTVLPEVAQKFHDLQDAMSQKFWAVAEQPIRNLINSLFPELSAGLKQTSTELGGFFSSLANSLNGQFNNALGGMFDDLAKSIAIASKHTDAFAQILRVLGEVGAGYLPQLAGWVGNLSDRFSNFLGKAQKDGSLKDWIDTGIFQIQELGRALGELGGIFAGIAKAAQKSGGSTLSMFADTLARVNETVNGSTFQTVLINALTAAHQAMSTIAEKSGPAVSKFFENLGMVAARVFPIMGETIGTALDAVASALSQPEVSSGLVAMFAGLQTAVEALAPAMGPVGKALGALMGIIGALAANIGPVLAVALTALSDVITNLSGPITTIIDLLGGALLTIVSAIAPPLMAFGQQLGAFFKEHLLPALKPIVGFITDLAIAVLPLLVDGASQVLIAIAPLIDVLGQLFEVVGPVLIPVLKFLASVLIDSIVGAVQGVVGVITGVIQVFKGLWEFISGVFTGNWSQAWQGIKDIFAGVWKALVGAFKVWLNVGILGVAGKVLKSIKAIFKKSWGAIKDALKKLWDNLGGSFKGFMHDMKSVGTSILRAIKNLFKSIWNDIKTFFRSVWHAMKSIISDEIRGVKIIARNGFNSVRDFIRNALNKAKSIVKSVWNAIKQFFSGGIGDVMGRVRQLPGKIKGVFSAAGGWLKDAGIKIIQGLIEGIGSMFNSVKSKLGDLTSKLTSWKGPEHVDRVVLHGAGQLVIDGFINGLESRYDAVRKSLKGLTQDVAGTEFDVPGINGSRSNLSAHLAAVVNNGASETPKDGKTFNYYAAPGSSIDAEEDLFAAVNRARMVGW